MQQQKMDTSITSNFSIGPQTYPLLVLVDRFAKKYSPFIELPLHQRDYVWEEGQRDQWIQAIIENNLAPNLISLYQIQGEPYRTLVNDGRQRIGSTLYFRDHSKEYGISPEKANNILANVSVSVDQRVYKNTDDVMAHFVIMQQGTQCTVYEQLHGIIAYMPGYKSKWEDFIEKRIHKVTDDLVKQLTSNEDYARPIAHKHYRDNYSLFLRLVTNDKTRADYASSSQKAPALNDKSSLENRLKRWLENESKSLDSSASLYKKTIEEAQALIKEIWGSKKPLNVTLVRWLFCCLIVFKNNNVSLDARIDFVKKILAISNNGISRLSNPNNENDSMVLQLSKASVIKKACEWAQSYAYDEIDMPKKRKSQPRMGAGMVASHTKSFSNHGDNGDIVVESAIANRARGNRDMTDEEIERLS